MPTITSIAPVSGPASGGNSVTITGTGSPVR
ncbi:IPT/TIG domain-containing protein [Nocardia abscessus]